MTYPPAGWTQSGTVTYDPSMALAVGEETIDRRFCTQQFAVAGGQIRGAIMRAKRTEQISQVRMLTGTTAAVATTDAWLAVYEIVQLANGTWQANLLGQTADDATLFSVASTPYQRALAAPFTKYAGHYYTVIALMLGATTTPTVVGATLNAGIVNGADITASPPLYFGQSGLAALPANNPIPGNIVTSVNLGYGVMLP